MSDDREPFKWGETPPDWFMKEMAEALRIMAANGEAVHAFDTKDFTFIQAICPVQKSGELAQAFGEAYLKVVGVGEALPLGPKTSLDFREFTLLAVADLNKKAARRVARLLDVAIAYGAIEHARGNASLQDTAAIEAHALTVLADVKARRDREH